jgi:hypothetical protein
VGWIANTIGPVKFGSPTPRAVARSMVLVLLAGACAGFATVRTSFHPDAIQFIVPAVIAALFALPNLGGMTEITLSPGSLLIRAWWWQAFGDRPVEAWPAPDQRWIGRTLHGKWFAGSHTIRMWPGEHRRFIAACEEAGIPIRDQRAAWQAAHPDLSILRGLLGAGAAILVAAAILVLVKLLLQFPGPADHTWAGMLGIAIALSFAGEAIVALSARLDARLAGAGLGSAARTPD